MSIYSEYIDGLMKLIETGRPDPLKEVIYARLKGIRKPVYGLISPPLGRDEPDENAVFYYLYEKLEAEKNEGALMELRRVVVELLMDALFKKEELFIIDALGQMAGVFQVKEFTTLAKQLRTQLWGIMCSKLGNPPDYTPLPLIMQLGNEEIEYAWRVLDLWLTVTPPMPKDRDAYYYDYIIELFENTMKNFIHSDELRFHLLILVFRALIVTKPYYAGRCGFFKMCQKILELDRKAPSNIHIHGWLGFCWELGVLFKYQQGIGKEWRKEFKEGILAIDDKVDNEPLFWDSLKRMDGLDVEIRKHFEKQPKIPKPMPLPEQLRTVYQ
jgi:hypothetical protein